MPCQFPITNPEHVRESFSFFFRLGAIDLESIYFCRYSLPFRRRSSENCFHSENHPNTKECQAIDECFLFSLVCSFFVLTFRIMEWTSCTTAADIISIILLLYAKSFHVLLKHMDKFIRNMLTRWQFNLIQSAVII